MGDPVHMDHLLKYNTEYALSVYFSRVFSVLAVIIYEFCYIF